MGFHLTLSEENERERERVSDEERKSNSVAQLWPTLQRISTDTHNRDGTSTSRKKAFTTKTTESAPNQKDVKQKKNGTDEFAEQEEMEQMYFST